MRILLLTALCLGLNIYVKSQPNIEWSELSRRTGRMISILPNSGKNFYALRWTGGGLLGNYTMSNHENLALTATGKVVMQANEGMASFEGITTINGKVIVFLSDRKEGRNHMYMQEYDREMKRSGSAQEIASYELEKGHSKGFFTILTSRDKNFFGVVWEIPGKKDEQDRYGFKVFDNEMNTTTEGDYKLPYPGKLSQIDQHYLTNKGDYFISVMEYSEPENKGIFRNYLYYKAMHILQLTNEGIEDFTINIEGKRVEAMTMSSDNEHIFTFIGIYGEQGKSGVSGVFFLRADFDKKALIDQGFERFGTDFITQDWSDRQKEKAEKREEKGKGEPQLYNYVVRQAEVLKDGSIVGSMEQYYVVQHTYTDPRTGAIRTTYTYYYNDIIAFKIGQSGFEWLKKIRKLQVSTNDGGPFSSYERYANDGKLCFIFNDNIKNYDETGNYIGDSKLYPANFGKNRNAVALVELDLQTGEMQRKTFFDRKEITALAVPKLFQIDYVTNELLLYAVFGKKERFGLMKINE
ncbi:MAG: hypothetical protein RL632_1358 [Bacteroidota bacterium]